jgi:hypothetical protein
MKNNQIIITVLIGIIALGAGFFGGMQYQKSQRLSFGNANGQLGMMRQSGAGNMMYRGGAGAAGARPVMGQIISSDDKSVTVKMQDGSTKIVLLSSSTSINKAAEGTTADLKSGETIAAFGTANSDGSITAQSIQLNPQLRMKPGASNSASPTPSY